MVILSTTTKGNKIMSKKIKPETKRVQIIKRLNKDFGDILPATIPIDQPVVVHSAKDRAGTNWLSWYFMTKDDGTNQLGFTKEQLLEDINAAVVGSKHTMNKLLKEDTWYLVPEGPGFTEAEECFQIFIEGDLEVDEYLMQKGHTEPEDIM